jgi:pimeloyl-ACP methyl ester carboxylesterase
MTPIITAPPARPEGSRRKYSLRLAALRLAFRLLGAISPAWSARWAYALWFRPRRYAPPAREQSLLAAAACYPISHAGKDISVYTWGKGPTILLVHGWSGRGTQLGAFVTPLVDAGYRVVAFDAPAHGRSSGHSTDLLEISAVILALADKFGPVQAVIAHSFGVACALHALRQRNFAARMVTLSAPATMYGLREKFARQFRVARPTMEILHTMMEARFGTDLWRHFSVLNLVMQVALPALVIHDRDDRDIPWQEGEAIAATWGAALMLTTGLGHRRLLRDPDVIARVTAFVGATAQRRTASMGRLSTR